MPIHFPKENNSTTAELEKYCRMDADVSRRLYIRFFPEPLSYWQVLWRILKAAVLFKLRLRCRESIPFLKCDNRGCVYVEFHDEITPAHVGKMCPRCWSNLLTQEDYENMEVG